MSYGSNHMELCDLGNLVEGDILYPIPAALGCPVTEPHDNETPIFRNKGYRFIKVHGGDKNPTIVMDVDGAEFCVDYRRLVKPQVAAEA